MESESQPRNRPSPDDDQITLWIDRLNDDRWIAPARSILVDAGKAGLDATLDAFKNPMSRAMHENAAEVLHAFGSSAVQPLLEYMQDQSDGSVSSTAWLLGNIGDPRAVEPLIRLLGHKVKFTRRAAACGLRKIGDSRAIEPLIKSLRDRSDMVSIEAVEALGEFGDFRAIPELERMLQKSSIVRFPGIVLAVERAIVKINDREQCSRLIGHPSS